MNSNDIFQLIELDTDRYISFLAKICSFEARAYDKAEIDRMVDYIEAFTRSEGFEVTRTPFETCGDFLTIDLNPGASKAGFLLAHLDTVHDKGVFGTPPVKIINDRMIGPGTVDCKGGVAVALLMMRALLKSGYPYHVRMILTTDEEISNVLGGEKEQQFIRDQVSGFPFALNCELTENNEVAVARKGILRYQIRIHGKGGHSGQRYFESKNAVLETAHKIIALESASKKDNISYSCNVIHGGAAPNAIPDECQFIVDIRSASQAGMQEAENYVQQITAKSFIGDTSASAVLLSKRPPMERREETMALFHRLNALSRQYGLGELTATEPGGGSDSAYTQAAGVLSICGLGPSGKDYHTPREYVELDSIPRRAKLLAALLIDQCHYLNQEVTQ